MPLSLRHFARAQGDGRAERDLAAVRGECSQYISIKVALVDALAANVLRVTMHTKSDPMPPGDPAGWMGDQGVEFLSHPQLFNRIAGQRFKKSTHTCRLSSELSQVCRRLSSHSKGLGSLSASRKPPLPP